MTPYISGRAAGDDATGTLLERSNCVGYFKIDVGEVSVDHMTYRALLPDACLDVARSFAFLDAVTSIMLLVLVQDGPHDVDDCAWEWHR